MTEEQLQSLLRLKRFEQPPPQYFDRLLQDIHRRQRAELLKRPLWKIALERVQTFFGEHSMSPASYAGAMATLLILGVGVIGVVGPQGVGQGRGDAGLAVATSNPPVAQAPRILDLQTASAPSEQFVLGWDNRAPANSSRQDVRHPRYIIDARPVSYEPSFSF